MTQTANTAEQEVERIAQSHTPQNRKLLLMALLLLRQEDNYSTMLRLMKLSREGVANLFLI